MINRPACWKQCYSALSTCGTRCTAGCVFQCTCAMHHEYRAPNLLPDALMLYVCWYISKLCVDTTVCCVQTCMCVLFMSKSVQICDSDRPDKPLASKVSTGVPFPSGLSGQQGLSDLEYIRQKLHSILFRDVNTVFQRIVVRFLGQHIFSISLQEKTGEARHGQ